MTRVFFISGVNILDTYVAYTLGIDNCSCKMVWMVSIGKLVF